MTAKLDQRGVPVVIRGVSYRSYSAAARALGIRPATLQQAAERGEEYLQRAGLGKYGRPVTIEGTTYPSKAAAHRATGVSMRQLKRRV